MKLVKSFSLLFLLTFLFSCNLESNTKKLNKPLVFEELIQFLDLKPNLRDKLLKSNGYELKINSNDSSYTNNQTTCKGEVLQFFSTSEFHYALMGSNYKEHYETIKKELEIKGYIFVTTKQAPNGTFREFYQDTLNNSIGLIFSILPITNQTNQCNVDQYIVAFKKIAN